MTSTTKYPDPPILLENVIEDLGAVKTLLERNAPYTPLGGWFRPDHGSGEATTPMWFQKTWFGSEVVVAGSDLFVEHPRVLDTIRQFYDSEVVIPHTLFVNVMAAITECGPVHTDNPLSRGRDRSNTPMLLLRTMLWSRLFERWRPDQATSIWWMNEAPTSRPTDMWVRWPIRRSSATTTACSTRWSQWGPSIKERAS